MGRDDFETVRELIALTFGVAPETITRETAREDFPSWDSLGHLNLMLGLEDTFQITLTVEEIARLSSVAAIVDYLQSVEAR
jgi:acyl carrier protein